MSEHIRRDEPGRMHYVHSELEQRFVDFVSKYVDKPISETVDMDQVRVERDNDSAPLEIALDVSSVLRKRTIAGNNQETEGLVRSYRVKYSHRFFEDMPKYVCSLWFSEEYGFSYDAQSEIGYVYSREPDEREAKRAIDALYSSIK